MKNSVRKETLILRMIQDCSYQGGALNVPTAFKAYGAVFASKQLDTLLKKYLKKSSPKPQTPYKVQSDEFRS